MAGGGVCRGRGRRLEQYWIPLTARVNFAAYAPPDLVAAWRAPPSGHIYAYIWPTGVGLVKAGVYVAHGVRAVLAT